MVCCDLSGNIACFLYTVCQCFRNWCYFEVYDSSLQESLHLEIGSYEELDGIDIMTDACHGWRKNAKNSCMVAIGDILHKVLQCIHITKADNMVSQRHELNI